MTLDNAKTPHEAWLAFVAICEEQNIPPLRSDFLLTDTGSHFYDKWHDENPQTIRDNSPIIQEVLFIKEVKSGQWHNEEQCKTLACLCFNAMTRNYTEKDVKNWMENNGYNIAFYHKLQYELTRLYNE